jgi:hypothetical protein
MKTAKVRLGRRRLKPKEPQANLGFSLGLPHFNSPISVFYNVLAFYSQVPIIDPSDLDCRCNWA